MPSPTLASARSKLGSDSMNWATEHLSRLSKGETVRFVAGGPSMKGRIEPGQLCTIEPVNAVAIEVGDIVLCRVPNGNVHLHLVKAIKRRFLFAKRYLIASNFGEDGWISHGAIFGKCVQIESAPEE
jgi:hypothetical protein